MANEILIFNKSGIKVVCRFDNGINLVYTNLRAKCRKVYDFSITQKGISCKKISESDWPVKEV